MFGLGKQNGPETANGHQGSGKVHLIDLHQVVKTFETPAGKFTALEDKTLQRELDGYADYAQQVRYRLVPGIW